jgi:hypothetical protein
MHIFFIFFLGKCKIVPLFKWIKLRRRPFSGILRRVAIVRTKISSNMVYFRSSLQLLVTANIFPILPIVVNPITETLRSTLTPVLTRYPRCNIPDDGVLQSPLWKPQILQIKLILAEVVGGGGCISPRLFDLGIRRRLVFIYPLRPLYPWGKVFGIFLIEQCMKNNGIFLTCVW